MRVAKAMIPMVMAATLAACGGGSALETAASTSSVATTPSVQSSTTEISGTTPGPPRTPATGPLTTPPTSRAVDPYLPAGVADQIFPPGTAAYQLLSAGDCGPLLQETLDWGGVPDVLTDLYTAAAEACLSQWAEAQAAFQRIPSAALCVDPETGDLYEDGSTSSFQSLAACQDQRLKVYRWTEDLLEAHEVDPSFVPNFPTPPTP